MSEARDQKLAFVFAQIKQAAANEPVSCYCGACGPAYKLFRCVYCGEFYCLTCAEEHFGKTRAEYAAEKIAAGLETVSDSPEVVL